MSEATVHGAESSGPRGLGRAQGAVEAGAREEWARLELHCQVNSVGPSDRDPDLARVVLSVPPADALPSDGTPSPVSALPSAGCEGLTEPGGAGGEGRLAAVVRWLMRAQASGLLTVESTGHERGRTEAAAVTVLRTAAG